MTEASPLSAKPAWRPPIQFRNLPRLEAAAGLSKATRSRVEEYNAAASLHETNRQNFLEQKKKTADAGILDVSAEEMESEIFNCSRATFARLLHQEIKLRREFDELSHACRPALEAAADKAHAEIAAAEVEIEKRLLGIGFLPLPLPGELPKGHMQIGWIKTHPLVCEARDKAEFLRNRAASNDQTAENEAEINKLQSLLERIRDRALAVA